MKGTAIKIGLVQLCSGDDVAVNLRQAEDGINEAVIKGANFVALPELMHLRVGPADAGRYLEHAQPIPGPITERFAQLAKRLGIHLLLGSIGEVSPDPARTYNTAVLLGPGGELVTTYRKLHLFDVQVDSVNTDSESSRCLPGDEVVLAHTPHGQVGLTICYDLRFPELFRSLALSGAQLVFVPANFTQATGEAHWLTLLRARAIENGLFIIAPAQCGPFPGGFSAFGHSAVIDPWGKVLLEANDQPGVHVVEIDLAEVDRVRRMIPSLAHRRPDVYGSPTAM